MNSANRSWGLKYATVVGEAYPPGGWTECHTIEDTLHDERH